MTLRAYRPNEPQDNNGYQQEPLDWQDTLLDRAPHSRTRHVAYNRAPRSRLWLWTGLFAAAAIILTAYFVIKGRSDGGAIPLVPAETSAYKTAPDSPGGENIPFQDKLVFNRLDPNGQPVQAEKLLPPPEEPMAAAPKAATSNTPVMTPITPMPRRRRLPRRSRPWCRRPSRRWRPPRRQPR